MVILDTDVLTIIQRRRGIEYTRLVRRLNQVEDEVVVTIVSFEEQMRGWLSYIARAKNDAQEVEGYARLRGLLEDFQTRPVLDYDTKATIAFQELISQKIRIGTMDLKIAAIALSHDALLITRNVRDFEKVSGLSVEDWTLETRG